MSRSGDARLRDLERRVISGDQQAVFTLTHELRRRGRASAREVALADAWQHLDQDRWRLARTEAQAPLTVLEMQFKKDKLLIVYPTGHAVYPGGDNPLHVDLVYLCRGDCGEHWADGVLHVASAEYGGEASTLVRELKRLKRPVWRGMSILRHQADEGVIPRGPIWFDAAYYEEDGDALTELARAGHFSNATVRGMVSAIHGDPRELYPAQSFMEFPEIAWPQVLTGYGFQDKGEGVDPAARAALQVNGTIMEWSGDRPALLGPRDDFELWVWCASHHELDRPEIDWPRFSIELGTERSYPHHLDNAVVITTQEHESGLSMALANLLGRPPDARQNPPKLWKICSWCQKVIERGHASTREEAERLKHVTHGICQECYRKIREELDERRQGSRG